MGTYVYCTEQNNRVVSNLLKLPRDHHQYVRLTHSVRSPTFFLSSIALLSCAELLYIDQVSAHLTFAKSGHGNDVAFQMVCVRVKGTSPGKIAYADSWPLRDLEY